MHDIQSIRKNAYIGILLTTLALLSCIFFISETIITTTHEIKTLAPVVRIWPMAPFSVLCLPFLLSLALLYIVKSIPCKQRMQTKIEGILIKSLILCFTSALFCLLFLAPLQYKAMPKLGYTHCNLLQGHPNMYFSDWVKKPEWCVRGKSREWVKDQALLTGNSEINP
jgi:phosphoglycerol transferase MdoB-like AlkP superfamily enzyme